MLYNDRVTNPPFERLFTHTVQSVRRAAKSNAGKAVKRANELADLANNNFEGVFKVFKGQRCAKFTLFAVYLFMLILVVMAVALPWLVIWYVETKGRPSDLATVVMVTCYPCAPFAAWALISARRLLKNIINGNVFSDKNATLLRHICLCCLFAGFIMLVAGFFYMPFYIAGGSALTCALVMKLACDIMNAALEKNEGTQKEEAE